MANNLKISPLLKSKIENSNNYENVYKNLKRHANDVKPNDPKAKLVRQNVIQKITDPIIDTYNDGKNFFKATRTGEMNDNNLGRINDLGMKAGALLIASFLASRAKTKTDAIMQFIGGTTFFASMTLWPKIFINLPAKIIHGFRIDHKYISAQGDKKDLGLDNQFQPMDIFSDEEMLKMAKNAGIDPSDPHAKEKMQRKLQKTMLQNRTLWMATAGFATPLLTSLTGSVLEPKIRDAVISHDYKKTKNILANKQNLVEYLNKAKSIPANDKEITEIFKGVQKGVIDDDFYKKLSDLLSIDNMLTTFKNNDDEKPIKTANSKKLISELKNLREKSSTVNIEDLKTILSKTETIDSVLSGLVENSSSGFMSKEQVEAIINELGTDYSIENLRKVLVSGKNANISDKTIEQIISTVKADNSKFSETIIKYNKEALPKLRGKIKAYLNLLNSVVGGKQESVYTKEYLDTMQELFETLGITNKEIKSISKGKISDVQEFIAQKMQQRVDNGSGYIEMFAPKTAKNKVLSKAMQERYEYMDELNSIMPEHLKTKVSAIGDKLKEIFGEDFYLTKDKNEMNNFIAYVGSDTKDWIQQIAIKSVFQDIVNDFAKSKNPDVKTLQNNLASVFGKDFYLLKDEGLLNSLVNDIKSNKEGWQTKIFDQFKQKFESGSIGGSINDSAPIMKNKIGAIQNITKSIESIRGSMINLMGKIFTDLDENTLKGKLKEIYNRGSGKDYSKGMDYLYSILKRGTERDFAQSTRPGDVENVVDQLLNRNSMHYITDIDTNLTSLTDAIIGGKEGDTSIFNKLEEFIKLQRIDLSSTKAKAIIYANFEHRLKAGDFRDLDKATIKATRQLLLDGNIAQWKNNANVANNETFNSIIGRIYNPSAFDKEEWSCAGIKEIVERISNDLKNNQRYTEQYKRAGSLTELIKDHATRLYENKAWKKIFVPMTVVLIAVTLLVQPLFGKIDKEFPENNKKGGEQ